LSLEKRQLYLKRREVVNSRMTTLTSPVPLSDDHPDELLSRSITPPLQTKNNNLSLEETYEIERTVNLLKEGNFKTIALQFPDDILHDVAEVSKQLQSRLDGVKTYILADTSYGRYVCRWDLLTSLVVVSMRLLLNILLRTSWCIMVEHVFQRITSC